MDTGFFLFITLVPLLFIIFYYFGIVRYCNLRYISSSEKFVNNYKNLRKASENKVVISLSTTPERIHKIEPMLTSILDQTVKVDEIVLNIPDEWDIETPKKYESFLTVIKCGQDYGKCNKFIPTVLRENDDSTIVIFLEDNLIYGKDFIETLIEEFKKNEDMSITTNGSILMPLKNVSKDVLYFREENAENNWIREQIGERINIKYNENYKF